MQDTRVIELLKIERECIRKSSSCDRRCGNCELVQDTDELLEMYKTAIELLKERKAIKPLFKTNPVTGTEQYLCGNCQRRFLFELDRYCPHCGKLVKWDG